MEPEVAPDPTPEEREAILAALAEEDGAEAAPSPYESSWRLAALEDL